MKFAQLSFKNWIVYNGEHTIDFSTSTTKPFTVIRGESEGGKSSILRAFRWCLYGNTSDKHKYQSPDLLLNREAKRDGEGQYEVQLIIEKDDEKIFIKRSRAVKKGKKITKDSFDDQVLEINLNGRVIAGEEAQKKIFELIHENISRFYLFDGEMLGDYAELIHGGSNYSEIKESIEDILMLPVLQHASNILHDISSEKLKKSTDGTKVNTAAEKARTQLEKKKQDEKHLLEQKNILLKNKKEYSEKLRDNEREQSNLINESDIDNFNNATENKESSADDMKNLQEQIRNLTGNLWLSVLKKKIKPLKAKTIKKKGTIEKQTLNQARFSILNELMEDKDISKDSKKLIQERIKVFKRSANIDASDASFDIKITENIINTIEDAKDSLESISNLYEKFLASKTLNINAINTINRLKDKGVKESSAETKERLKKEERALVGLIAKIDGSLAKDGKIETDIQKISGEIELLRRKANSTRDGTLAENTYLVADFLHSIFSLSLERATTDMKRKVDLSANEIYETLRKYRFEHFDSTNKLLINNDYGLEVMDENNEFIETSEGGSQVCAITLITALKENINHDAPLLMDSPFMRIDDEYRQALVDLYAVKSKQTILLVSPTELIEGSDLDRKIKDLAEKRYSITRTSDVESEVLPL